MTRKFDLHTHTTYSDGHGVPIAMVESAESKGLEAVAITDHGPELGVGIRREMIPRMIEDVNLAKNGAKTKVLVGLEANAVNDSGDIDIDESIIKKLDILVVGIHYVTRESNPEEMARSYLQRATKVVEKNRFDVLAHPFSLYHDLLPYLSREDIEDFVKLVAERQVAMEINVKYKAPGTDFLQLCLKEGVKLSVGTDSHSPADVGKVDWAYATLAKVGAKNEDLVIEKFL
jgi:putative hydrolase